MFDVHRYRQHEGDDQLEMWPEKPTVRWRYVPAYVVGIVILMLVLTGNFT